MFLGGRKLYSTYYWIKILAAYSTTAKETKNYVGLSVIIGENVSDSAYNLVNTSHVEVVKRIVLVDKPLVQSQL